MAKIVPEHRHALSPEPESGKVTWISSAQSSSLILGHWTEASLIRSGSAEQSLRSRLDKRNR